LITSLPPEHIASAYFNEVQKAFRSAEHIAGGCTVRQYRIGGRIVRLIFAGTPLMPLFCPAIEHLSENGSTNADFEILLWDAESTGIAMPNPPWQIDEIVQHSEIWRVNYPNVKINFNPHNSTFDLVNLNLNLGIYHASTTQHITQHESGSPALQILKWWFNQGGQYVLHAGAVGTPEGGVLLVGKGGSGKSTTALMCLNAGLFYVGDDYCLLGNSEHPYVYSLYSSAKVNLNKLDWFPFLKPDLSPYDFPGAEKALFLLNKERSAKMLSGFPVKAVLLPQVTGLTETTIFPVSPAQAMLALAPSTIFQFRGTTTHAFESMSRLVREVPCFALRLGTDRSMIAKSIQRILQ